MRHDYVPRNDLQFHQWFLNLRDYVIKMRTKWAYIPQSAVDALDAAFVEWEDYFIPTQSAHTPAVTALKNAARRKAEPIVRNFVQQFLRWPPVTDGDLVNMNLPLRDLTRTPHIEVTEDVEFEIRLRSIREVLINFWVKGLTNMAKPAGYDGAVIVWDVLEAPPTTPDMLNRHQMASRTPFALEFDETERGQTVYVTAAWQNERGMRGRWSEIQSAVIP